MKTDEATRHIVTGREAGVLRQTLTQRAAQEAAQRFNERPGPHSVLYVVERRGRRWAVVAYQARAVRS